MSVDTSGRCSRCGVMVPPDVQHACSSFPGRWASGVRTEFGAVVGGRVMMDEKHEPKCCPVCGGRGEVSSDFYEDIPGIYKPSTTAAPRPVTCRGCGGTGVVR